MKQALALSVIIPAYNEEEHLAACLDSLAAQTRLADEVIVVDNNSTDNTVRIAKKYPFVRVVTAKDQGIVHARNKGFDSAKHELIARIDSDSIVPVNWIELLYEEYAKHDTPPAITGGGYFYNVPFPRVSSWVLDQIAFRLNRVLMRHYILYGSNMVIPKAVWQQVKKDICLRTDIHEDLDLAIHVNRAGCPIVYKAHIRVGVKMRRVFQDQSQLWANMMMWPQTLRVHGLRRWIYAWIGGATLFVLTPLTYPFKLGQIVHAKLSR